MSVVDKAINKAFRWENKEIGPREMIHLVQSELISRCTEKELRKLLKGLSKNWVLAIGHGASLRILSCRDSQWAILMDYSILTHGLREIVLRDYENKVAYYISGEKTTTKKLQRLLIACVSKHLELYEQREEAPNFQSKEDYFEAPVGGVPKENPFTPNAVSRDHRNVSHKSGKYSKNDASSLSNIIITVIIFTLAAAFFLGIGSSLLQILKMPMPFSNRNLNKDSQPAWVSTVRYGYLGEFTDMTVDEPVSADQFLPDAADALLDALVAEESFARECYIGKYILLYGNILSIDGNTFSVGWNGAYYKNAIHLIASSEDDIKMLGYANAGDLIVLQCRIDDVNQKQGYLASLYSILEIEPQAQEQAEEVSIAVTEPPASPNPEVSQSNNIGTVLRSAGEINLRSGPGTSYATVGRLSGGCSIAIYEQQYSEGRNWGRTDGGWVCMDYIVFGVDNSSPALNQSELDAYCGTWWDINSHRCNMLISRSGDKLNIFISWSSGASDTTQWSFVGEYDYSEKAVYYWNGICTETVTVENQGIRDFTRYTNGEGVLLLRDGYITWYDAIEHAGDSCKFSLGG